MSRRPKCSLSCQRPLTRLLSHSPDPSLARSLARNEIRAKGASALAAVLKEAQITNLKCAATPECSPFCQRPFDTPAPTLCIGSLANSSICGVTTDVMGRQQGTYTAEGITKLCEGLKGSAVTSLKCAAAPACSRLPVNAH